MAHALDPKSGKHLWSAKVHTSTLYPLTDLFLSSCGVKGHSGSGFCGYHVFANGFIYGTKSYSQAQLVAKRLDDEGGMQIVWSHPTMSRSCPPPTPAYGRLYYTGNGEGVVYCFENAK